MRWLRHLLGFDPIGEAETFPPLSERERAEILHRLDMLESEQNDRMDRVQQSLHPLMAEAGLEDLRTRLGRPHG